MTVYITLGVVVELQYLNASASTTAAVCSGSSAAVRDDS